MLRQRGRGRGVSADPPLELRGDVWGEPGRDSPPLPKALPRAGSCSGSTTPRILPWLPPAPGSSRGLPPFPEGVVAGNRPGSDGRIPRNLCYLLLRPGEPRARPSVPACSTCRPRVPGRGKRGRETGGDTGTCGILHPNPPQDPKSRWDAAVPWPLARCLRPQLCSGAGNSSSSSCSGTPGTAPGPLQARTDCP